MRRAALVVVLLALAGCRSSHTHAHPLPAGAIVLRPLPPQGLVDEMRRGVALRDLRGRRLVWLPGFAVYPRSDSAQVSLEYLLSARQQLPFLHGPHGWYRLDPARHALVRVRHARLPLAGSAAAVAHRGYVFTVERRGQVLLRGSVETGFSILSDRLVQAGRTLLDVASGRRWKLPPGCLFAGFRGRTVLLACGIAHGAEGAAPLVLERMTPGGAVSRVAPKVAELIPQTALLSPDRAWIAVEGDTGCAARYVYVAPVRGGRARIVYGRSTNPFAANFSKLLGWNADGRLVVLFESPYCDEPYGPQHPPRGVYLVDPRTLARTFVTKTADAMWSPPRGAR